jgi:SAM-dependent methyltransferase
MPSQKTTRLLHTKLMPPRLPARMIARERLLARLDEGPSRKVSLISAPTGFGKTTLIRTWIASREVPSACLALADKPFDLTFCQAGFKNFSEPVRAIADMHRVLRPGGTSVISDLRPYLWLDFRTRKERQGYP